MRRKKQVTIEPIKLNFNKYDIESLSAYLESSVDSIFEKIVDMITNAITLKLNEIDVFEFDSPNDILVFKKVEWKGFLERAMFHFLKKEKYEICNKIKNTQMLLSPIKKKRGRKLKSEKNKGESV